MKTPRGTLLDASGNVISGDASHEAITAMELASDRLIVEIAARGVTTDKWLYMFPGESGKVNTGLTVVGAKELFERVYGTTGKVVDAQPLPSLPFPKGPATATMIGLAVRYEAPDGKTSSMEMIYQPWWMERRDGSFDFDIMAPRKLVGKAIRNCQRDLTPEKELRRFEAFCVKHHSKHVQMLGSKDARLEGDPRVAAMIRNLHGIAAQAVDKAKGEKVPEGKVVAYVEAALKQELSKCDFATVSKAAQDLRGFLVKVGRDEFRKVVLGMPPLGGAS